jgi:hypothetical protein
MLAAIKQSALAVPATATWLSSAHVKRYPDDSRKGTSDYRDQQLDLIELVEIVNVRKLDSADGLNSIEWG